MSRSPFRFCLLLSGLLAAAVPIAAQAQDTILLRAREGAAALMRGQYDKAIATYDEALAAPEIADFIRASLYADRGVAKWRATNTKEAIDDFNKSIQLSPDNAAVYNNRGNALMDLGHADEAVKDFDRAIALSPNYGAAYNNRGNARVSLGQHNLAFQDFRKAVELMPQSAVPFNGLGHGPRRVEALPRRGARLEPRHRPQPEICGGVSPPRRRLSCARHVPRSRGRRDPGPHARTRRSQSRHSVPARARPYR